MQTAKPLTNSDTLREVGFLGRKESDQVSSAGADIVNREPFRAGRTTDINDLSQFVLEIDKGTFLVAYKRADNQEPFTGFAFQLECEPRVALKYGFIS